MNKGAQVNITKPTLHFKKWSRKTYAEFVSIGRHVVIGRLKKGVADCSLSKQTTYDSSTCRIESMSTDTYLEKDWIEQQNFPNNLCNLYFSILMNYRLDIFCIPNTIIYKYILNRYISYKRLI